MYTYLLFEKFLSRYNKFQMCTLYHFQNDLVLKLRINKMHAIRKFLMDAFCNKRK